MRGWLAAVIGLYVVFALAAAHLTPYRTAGILLGQRDAQGQPQRTLDVGAPDERQHANYVRHLMDGNGFPVLRPGTPDLYETYQSHQPPTYYLLAAGWAKVTGADPTSPGSGLALRLLSVAIGVVTLLGVYQATRVGLGRDDLGVLAVAMVGLTPMFVALNAAVSNDPLLFALMTWCFASMVTTFRTGWTPKLTVGLGVLLGLALLTKTTALALFPTLLVAMLLTAPAHRRLAFRNGVIAGVVGAGMASPWWWRNTDLYGDPFGLRVFREAFVGTAQREQMIQMVAQLRTLKGLDPGGAAYEYWTQWFGWWTLRSWFGAFGQMDIFLPPWVYALLVLVGLVGVLGAVLGFKTFAEDPPARAYAWTGLVLIAVVTLLFVQFNLTYFQAQGRYLYPAVAAIGGGLAFGLGYAFRRLETSRLILGVILAGIALNLFVASVVQTQFQRRVLPPVAQGGVTNDRLPPSV